MVKHDTERGRASSYRGVGGRVQKSACEKLLKNIFIFFLKTLDKLPSMWYNRSGALKRQSL